MQVTETLSEGLKREYKVIVPANEIESQIVEKLSTLQKTAEIKGFRPGKAPLALLRKRFEKAVMDEVLSEAINKSSEQAMMDHSVRPAMKPEVDMGEFENGADLEYTLSLETLPDIEPGDLKGMEVTRLKVEVGDHTVDEAVQKIADEQKDFGVVEEVRDAAEGDALRIDFLGRIDGEAFEGGSAEAFQIEIGSNSLVPGFEEQLIGAKVGDDVEVTVTFPEDYPGEAVAGKDAVFEVKVHQLLGPKKTAVDDALAERMGLDDLAALRAAVRDQIDRDYGTASRTRLKRDILDKLAAEHDFEVPPGMLEREFESIWQQITHDMEHENKTWDDMDETEEEAREEYRHIAERRIRLGLLLSEIGQRNEIVVPQEELNRAVMDQARRYPGQEQQIFDYFRSNQQAMSELQAPLYEDKVIDFIIEMANVEEKTATGEELFADPKDADAKAE
jgi:trigger factor